MMMFMLVLYLNFLHILYAEIYLLLHESRFVFAGLG